MQTRTKYLEKLEDLSALLGQLGEKSVLDVRAVGRALAGEEQAAEGVVAGDKASRHLRSAIEDRCLDIMLMQQPLVADDLREVTGAFRIVSDLAHIEEMARDVAYLSQQLTPKAPSVQTRISKLWCRWGKKSKFSRRAIMKSSTRFSNSSIRPPPFL